MCAGFFLLHSKCYRPDGYLICMTLCAILNLDEMKSVPMRLQCGQCGLILIERELMEV